MEPSLNRQILAIGIFIFVIGSYGVPIIIADYNEIGTTYFDEDLSLENKQKTFTKEIILRFIQVFLLFSITVMFNSTLALILFDRYGASTSTIGIVMTVSGVTIFIYGVFLMKPLFKKVGEKRILLIASILLIVNFFMFPFMTELWMIFGLET